MLFLDLWKFKKPDLVLTLYGSIPTQKSFQKRLYNILFGVFQKTSKFKLPTFQLLAQYGLNVHSELQKITGYHKADFYQLQFSTLIWLLLPRG